MDYNIDSFPLAEGKTGTVYSTKDGKYALKYIDYAKQKFTNLNWIIEISVLNHMRHNKIVKLIDVIETRAGCFIVMPKLYSLSRVNTVAFCEKVKEQIALDIAEATSYLHQRGFIHTDIKIENILINIENNRFQFAALADMSAVVATSFKKLYEPTKNLIKPIKSVLPKYKSSQYKIMPKLQYYKCYPECSRPPEIIKRQFLTFASDVWAFGTFLISLTKGRPVNIDECEKNWDEFLDELLTGKFKPIIKACLTIDADKRLSIHQVIGFPPIEDYQLSTSKYTMFDLVDELSTDYRTTEHIKSLLNIWTKRTTISSDCVEFCKYIISKTFSHPDTKDKFENNAYLVLMICFNISFQLFHPQIDVELSMIFRSDSESIGFEYIDAVMWIFREIFRYNIFS